MKKNTAPFFILLLATASFTRFVLTPLLSKDNIIIQLARPCCHSLGWGVFFIAFVSQNH